MSNKRLHIVLKNKWQTVIIDEFIHHIDAVTSHTLAYLSDFSDSESDIIRMIETIDHFFISGDGVVIYYESGAELLITRVRA